MEEGDCKVSSYATKYHCIKCSDFVCNKNFNCSVFASESLPGWQAGKSVALCKPCDAEEMGANEKEATEFDTEDANGQANDLTDRFIVACASRGFHEYRKIWKPKLGQRLRVAFEKYNVYDPYCCALYARSKCTIHGRCVVGHIPRELSRFCKYFLDYSGVIDATVTSVDFRRSPIPQGELEIPVNLHIIKSASSI